MPVPPGVGVDGPRRPARPLVTRGWLVACAFAALFIGDRVDRRAHRPICVEACASEGRTLLSTRVGSSGRGSLLDNSITCRCSHDGPLPRYVVRYMTFKEHFDWLAADVIVFGSLLGTVAGVRWLWRPRP